MSFEQTVRIPLERVAVVIGREGGTKRFLEEKCGVKLSIDGKEGIVTVRSESLEKGDPFRAVQIVEAVGRGFSPKNATHLLEDNVTLVVLDLREFAGKSDSSMSRIKGRIIGLNGKSRRVIEELTGCRISVYGRTVSIIGDASKTNLATESVRMLASGSPHRTVYKMLQDARAKQKLERMLLWEGQSPEGTRDFDRKSG